MPLPLKHMATLATIMGGFVMIIIVTQNKETIIKRIIINDKETCASEDKLRARLVGSISQDDPELIQYIRNYHLWPPSKKPYHFSKQTKEERSSGQADKVREILKDQRNGFFIECGAYDGEFLSNTLTLEQKFGWRGILIEADPENFHNLTQRNRKAWTSNVCLSVKPYPEKVSFSKQGTGAGIIPSDKADKKEISSSEVQCFPLYSILLAMNQTTIDYFSLDIEGAELDMLKTIPFSKVDIKVMTVEYNHVKEGKEALKQFLESLGYMTVGEVRKTYAADFVFVKKNITEKIETRKRRR